MRLKEYINEKIDDSKIENYIRDSLSGTKRKTTAELMFNGMKKALKGVTKSQFMKVWKDLVDDGYLIQHGTSFSWEI